MERDKGYSLCAPCVLLVAQYEQMKAARGFAEHNGGSTNVKTQEVALGIVTTQLTYRVITRH